MSQVGKYLNLKPHMSSWRVYNQGGPYTTAYSIGSLAPAQFGGLSYRIRQEKGNDVYIIYTETYGLCAIWAPVDNDSSFTTSPAYANGDLSTGTTPPTTAQIIAYARNKGLFKGTSLTFSGLDVKTPISILSFNPPITAQGEISLKAKLGSSAKTYIIGSNSSVMSTSLTNNLKGVNVDFAGQANLKLALDTISLTGNINGNVKYTIEQSATSAYFMTITFEATMTYEGVTIYQRLIITVSTLRLNFVTVPVPKTSTQTANSSVNYSAILGYVALGTILGITVVGGVSLGITYLGMYLTAAAS